ncbi:MAG: UDP-2,4-diacetamido-2,4,6-trideoxy-beta-L-altropyranose hydrolase [Clostridiales bacterium]|nr:UDP-2,4-diacetamido-2,4,6-trideoxy-beta-L-altropyranose hydrolase [Clostridiales bacterium]
MRVLIFTEGGKDNGLGHIYRCISLYDEIESRGVVVELVINTADGCMSVCKNKKVKQTNWLNEDFLDSYISSDDYCIVDSYLVDENLLEIMSEKCEKCLFIDDFSRVNYPKGIVVNPSILINTNDYPQSKERDYLLGLKYIILRNAFNNSKRLTINKEVKRVMITLGGSDIRNLTRLVIHEISTKYPKIIFDVVIGKAYENFDEIKNYDYSNIKYHLDLSAEEMKGKMLASDLVITAAGQTIFELLATETPFIPIKVAENQKKNMIGLKELRLIDDILFFDDKNFVSKLKKQFEDILMYNYRFDLFCKYHGKVDEKGTKRIIDFLMDNSKKEEKIFLRCVKFEDMEDVFRLSNENYVRRFSINCDKIDWENHKIWFSNMLNSDENIFYIVTDKAERFLGQIRYKIESNTAVVSISLDRAIIGRGVSSVLLDKSMSKLSDEIPKIKKIIAFVSKENIASKKIFEKTGYILSSDTKDMFEYIYNISKE